MTMLHFWAQNGQFAPIFLWEIITIILIYLLALSLCKILKKLFQLIQSYEDVQFLDPKWPIYPNENCFFYSCLLYAKNQSQILIY